MEKTSGRLRVLALLVALMFVALTARLWFLQVLAADQSKLQAKQNGTRTIRTSPVRGNILDDTGKVLVGNRQSLEVQVSQQQLGPHPTDVLKRLSTLLKLPLGTIEARLHDNRYYPYQPIPVAQDVASEVAFYVGEHQDRFPGVQVVQASIGDYPYSTLAAHILGYVGPITAAEIAQPQFDPKTTDYTQNDIVGQTGLEAQYEQYLQGTKGLDVYAVDAAGKQIRSLGSEPAVPGDNVVLSVDAQTQQQVEQALSAGIQAARTQTDSNGNYLKANAGAAVVMDPSTGAIKAIASWPTYDPRWFVEGMTSQEYRQRFLSATAGSPELNRAEAQVYAPGSTFKPFVALSALKSGVASETGSYSCPSIYTYPGDPTHQQFHNVESANLGYMNLATALRVSCDTIFYGFGAAFYNHWRVSGQETLQNDLQQFGFASPTGVDLPYEPAGLLPGDAYAQQNKSIYPYGWLAGNEILTAIGQDSVAVTPLQLVTAYSAIANGGKLCRPHLADHIEAPGGHTIKTITPKCRTIPYTPQQLDFIRQALTQVPVSGTAASAFVGFPLSTTPVAGKTGTAQRAGFQDTSWFAAMVPAANPKYVVVVMVEQGGFGAQTAAPIVRHIIEGLYNVNAPPSSPAAGS